MGKGQETWGDGKQFSLSRAQCLVGVVQAGDDRCCHAGGNLQFTSVTWEIDGGIQ